MDPLLRQRHLSLRHEDARLCWSGACYSHPRCWNAVTSTPGGAYQPPPGPSHSFASRHGRWQAERRRTRVRAVEARVHDLLACARSSAGSRARLARRAHAGLLPRQGGRRGGRGRRPLAVGRRADSTPIGALMVESGAGALTLGSGGCSVAFAPVLSPAPMASFPVPRSSNRTCGFPASGFRTRSCLRARKAPGLPRETREAIVYV